MPSVVTSSVRPVTVRLVMQNAGVYSAAEAARLAKVPKSTLSYWARTDLIVPSRHKQRPRLYTFEDLRDLVVANTLRGQGARTRDIRTAIAYVQSVDDVQRLAQANFGVFDGQLVYLDEDGNPVAPHKGGQRFFRVKMGEVFGTLGVDDPQHPVMRPAKRISVNPEVRGGTPVIEGTRIPTKLIAELVDEGAVEDEVAALYPRLTPEDVAAALAWERSLAS